MRTLRLGSLSGATMIGVGVGMLAGVAAGLLFAPTRGTDMRRSLRSRADDAMERGMRLVAEGRRAFRTNDTPAPRAEGMLTATIGEIAQFHEGGRLEVQS